MKYFIFGLIAALVGQAQAQAPSTWARVSSKNLVCRTFVDQGKLTFYIMQDNLGNALTLFRMDGNTQDADFVANARQKLQLCNATLAQINSEAGILSFPPLMVNLTTGATEPESGFFVKQPSAK